MGFYLNKDEMSIIKKEWQKRKYLTQTSIVGLATQIKQRIKSYNEAERLVTDYEKLLNKFEK